MSLIVETGSGDATAESYCSVAAASTYHADRGNAAWAALASDALREQALRKATDYMLQKYRTSWKGVRQVFNQALDWPRLNVMVDEYRWVLMNTVPNEVIHACAELALKAATAELNPDLSQQILQQTVGPISTTYSESSPQSKRYASIDMMLRPLLTGSSISHQVVRS